MGASATRWTGRYVLLHDGSGGDPSHVGTFGSSGD